MKKLFTILVLAMLFAPVVNSNAQNMRGGVQVSLAMPMGTFGDVHATGFGAMGTFYYGLNPQIDLTGTIGFLTFGAASDIPEGFDYSLNFIPVVVGGRYNFVTSGEFKPYAGAELGLHFGSASVTVDMGPFGKIDTDESTSDFSFAPLAGFYYNIGPKLQLDVNVKMNIISDANYLGINAGVAFGL